MLEITRIYPIKKSQFGYPTRRVEFFDTISKLKKNIPIFERHKAYATIWNMIEREGIRNFPGKIMTIRITEELIRSVLSFKYSKIKSFRPIGLFVVIHYGNHNESDSIKIAVSEQIYEYVDAEDRLLEPDEPIA